MLVNLKFRTFTNYKTAEINLENLKSSGKLVFKVKLHGFVKHEPQTLLKCFSFVKRAALILFITTNLCSQNKLSQIVCFQNDTFWKHFL